MFIVEARSTFLPPLYSVGPKCMMEVPRELAKRYVKEMAQQIAREEARLRGKSRRVFIIHVED